MTALSIEQMQEFKKLFDLFVTEPDSEVIEKSVFIRLVRATGMNPTEKEAQAMMAQCNTHSEDMLSFGEFCKIMEQWFKTVDEVKDELRQAFQKFDKLGDGTVSRTDLKKVITEIGKEAMSREEMDEVLSMANFNKENRCEYEELIKILQGEMDKQEEDMMTPQDAAQGEDISETS